jgi:hypothetical protein
MKELSDIKYQLDYCETLRSDYHKLRDQAKAVAAQARSLDKFIKKSQDSQEALQYLMQYSNLLNAKKLELREQSCKVAAIIRSIEKEITIEDREMVAEQDQADRAWSFQPFPMSA